MIKGVIFDMDGTMFDTEGLSSLCWKKAGEKLGLAITDELVESIRGRNPSVIRGMFKDSLGEDLDYDGARRVKHEFFAELTANGVPMKKGLVPLLEFLKEEGIPAAVATSTERARAEKMMKSTGVYDYFAAWVCGDAVEASKPAPDIFLEAARRLGRKPEECLVLEDSGVGLRAGVASGCHTIYIPDLAKTTEEDRAGIEAQLADLEEVIGWIRERQE